MNPERKLKQDIYIRVCKDSGFKMEYIEAAKLVAKVLGCHPFEVYAAFGDLDNMRKVASGDHPVCQK